MQELDGTTVKNRKNNKLILTEIFLSYVPVDLFRRFTTEIGLAGK